MKCWIKKRIKTLGATAFGANVLCAITLFAAVLCSACGGQTSSAPRIVPEDTLPPLATPTAEPTPTVTPTAEPVFTPEPTPTPSAFDELGQYISGVDHFKRYLSFRNVQVYEQEEDTFVDVIVANQYPRALVCAAGAAFYDENGELVAEGRFQTRDGQYVLVLPQGETTLFAQVDTDMTLTALTLEIVFDEALGVLPDAVGQD